MSERLELPSSLSKGVAWENMKPHPGALTQSPLWWQCTNSSGRTVLEGERSFFSLLYFSSLCFPFPYSRGCSAMMQFTASLASEQKLMLPKEMVKFAKVQIPPELFKPEWPNMRGICVTHVTEIPSWLRQCMMLFSYQWMALLEHPKIHHWWEFLQLDSCVWLKRTDNRTNYSL